MYFQEIVFWLWIQTRDRAIEQEAAQQSIQTSSEEMRRLYYKN